MAKTQPEAVEAPAAPALVSVRLKSIYSGHEGNPGPGTIIEVDADEAARLVEVAGADLVEPVTE